MDHKTRNDPDEVLRDLLRGTISPEGAANELWCMADQRETWCEDPGEALSRFKGFGLGFEASDPDYELGVDTLRAEVVALAREILAAGGVDDYDRQAEVGAAVEEGGPTAEPTGDGEVGDGDCRPSRPEHDVSEPSQLR